MPNAYAGVPNSLLIILIRSDSAGDWESEKAFNVKNMAEHSDATDVGEQNYDDETLRKRCREQKPMRMEWAALGPSDDGLFVVPFDASLNASIS